MRTIDELLIGFITAYRRALSPLLPDSCRYEPSCSRYAIEALKMHGVLKGVSLSLRRILRCRPFGGRGYDPVPDPPTPGGRSEM